MAKNKTPKKNGFNTQKIFKWLRVAALALPAATVALGPGTPQAKINLVSRKYFGFDMMTGKFKWQYLAEGWTPFVAATAVTYGIPKLAGMIRGFGK